eukprot:TRINITY_DN58564_c0_g1_i1.p1 TRINITY_DN58564_c0_g1~~TRINITY_DN58564_c0_g1_i1.p1  ORF type:complete len:404 (-),score=39.87 TRINITY_DN58564_c0_g1_i1:83-1198(-)
MASFGLSHSRGLNGLLASCMVAMLASGALNTLLMKFMVIQQVQTGPNAPPSGFDHPFFQSLLMMLGELLCLAVFFGTTKRRERAITDGVPRHIFAVACSFDWTATTLVNMAYAMIAASVVQMTRGAIVIFTCFLSVVFLGRKQHLYHVVGVVLVAIGITFVSLSAFVNPIPHSATAAAAGVSTSASTHLLGISLCIGAQIFQASMLVYEELIMSKYSVPPLQVVGMEGAFGTVLGIILLAILNAASIENTSVAAYQMTHSQPLLLAIIGSVISIAVFNFSGVTVTQQASAVARSTIDVSRTIVIWSVELLLGWNTFNYLQLFGFVCVAIGTMLYNRILVVPLLEPPGDVLSTKADILEKYGATEKGEQLVD